MASVLLACGLLGGCTDVVTGNPTVQDGASVQVGESEQFDKLLEECDAVPNDKIAETAGGSGIERYFLGAICMWKVQSPQGVVDVTFAWFENNVLSHEREVAQQLNYQVTDVTVVGSTGFAARRPGTPESCGVAVTYSGVVTWWVQSSGGLDPCEVARTLAELTLNRNV